MKRNHLSTVALVAYAKEQVRRRSLDEAVKSSQESLRLANQLYVNGLSNFINVLDAARSLYQAQDALVHSDKTVTADVFALYKSLGGGWETETRPVALASAKPAN
jgi:multidrug efflux system outer membrane protein